MTSFLSGFSDELEKIAISKKKLLLAALGIGAGKYFYDKNKKPMSELEKMMRKGKKLKPPGGGKISPTGLFHPSHIRGRSTFSKTKG